MANLFIIAGPNGAGKSTASLAMLRNIWDCNVFINSDDIAAIINPLNPEKAEIEASRRMLRRIDEQLAKQNDFAIETTLSARSLIKLVRQAQQIGYKVHLFFFWLASAEQAQARVKQRVSEGGHHVADDVIFRRYYLGLKNLVNIYLPACDYVAVIDKSKIATSDIVRKETLQGEIKIFDAEKWKQINDNATYLLS